MRLALMLALVLAACSTPREDPWAAWRDAPLQAAFDGIARAQGVPPELLVAVAWHRSSLEPSPGAEEHGDDGHAPAAHGWLALSAGQRAEAAALVGLTVGALDEDPLADLWASAAWLRGRADGDAQAAVPGARWWSAVAGLVETDERWLGDSFAQDVFDTVQTGLEVRRAGDSLGFSARDLPDLEGIEPLDGPLEDPSDFASVQGYPGRARYLPAHPNGDGGPRPSRIRRVVIHTIEGSYEGGIAWARSPTSNAGFQYIIRRSDGEITQMVPDDVMGWHACNNNADTIGIEHDGRASEASTWTPAMLDASARLTGWLARRYDIPVDRNHIVGHGEIQPAGCAGRYDPGPYFPWSDYMQAVAWYKAEGWDADGAASARLFVDVPRNGQQVGHPFLTRVRSPDAASVSVWLGGRKVADHVPGELVDLPVQSTDGGWKKLKVRAWSEGGAALATTRLRVQVRRQAGDVAPVVDKIDGLDYLLGAEPERPAAYVRYWTNGGRAIRDLVTDRLRAHPDDFELVAGFENAGAKLLLARAYRDDGLLVGEGWRIFDANTSDGPPAELRDLQTLALPTRVLRVAVAADPAVRRVRYKVDGAWATDAGGEVIEGSGPDFSADLWFEVPGAHRVKAIAYDAAGTRRDDLEATVEAPGPGVELTWQRVGALRYRLDASAPAGTERVVFYRGATLLFDAGGRAYASSPFVHDVALPAGPNAISVVARDALGLVLGSTTVTIDAS